MNQTINDIFFSVVERNLDQAMLYKQTIKWIPISSRELYRDVIGTARSLAKWGIAIYVRPAAGGGPGGGGEPVHALGTP
jgi:hypothetical protein